MPKVYTIVFIFSVAITAAAFAIFAVFGLRLGVDFRGGSILELEFSNNRPDTAELEVIIKTDVPDLKNFSLTYAGEKDVIMRADELSEQQHQDLLEAIGNKLPNSGLTEKRFDSVGPIIGQELKHNSIIAIFIVLGTVMVYIALVFRKVSVVLSPWAMGIAAIAALFHDIIVPVGVFVILGRYYGVEISAVFVAAILTILGFSVSDTVVIFDRIRENVIRNRARESFGPIVHKSVMQTLTRSLNTTFTVLLSLVAIYFFGGESLRYFTLALIMGIFLGAYSSIFVASPLLYYWSQFIEKKK